MVNAVATPRNAALAVLDVATERTRPRRRRRRDDAAAVRPERELLGYAPTWLVDALTITATIGELWMIGYLLVVGIRPAAEGRARAAAPAAT
jgi:hypothetical protein